MKLCYVICAVGFIATAVSQSSSNTATTISTQDLAGLPICAVRRPHWISSPVLNLPSKTAYRIPILSRLKVPVRAWTLSACAAMSSMSIQSRAVWIQNARRQTSKVSERITSSPESKH